MTNSYHIVGISPGVIDGSDLIGSDVDCVRGVLKPLCLRSGLFLILHDGTLAITPRHLQTTETQDNVCLLF